MRPSRTPLTAAGMPWLCDELLWARPCQPQGVHHQEKQETCCAPFEASTPCSDAVEALTHLWPALSEGSLLGCAAGLLKWLCCSTHLQEYVTRDPGAHFIAKRDHKDTSWNVTGPHSGASNI